MASEKGIPLTEAYDDELYGQGTGVTGYAAVAQDFEEDEQDEREQAVARSVRPASEPE
jgi:hypothetical protein